MNSQLSILLWKEWRQQRTSLLFLLALIPCGLALTLFLFGERTSSGAVAFMSSVAGGSFFIGILAFTGELWVGENRIGGLDFTSRLPASPVQPALAKWLFAAFVPLLLGLYGMGTVWAALHLFGDAAPVGSISLTRWGLQILIIASSVGFWMLALGRLLPRLGLGILLALLLHLVYLASSPMAFRISPDLMVMMVPMWTVGALAAFFFPILIARFAKGRVYAYGFSLSFFLLSLGAAILGLQSMFSVEPMDRDAQILGAYVGHGERFALMTYAGGEVEKTYLLDLEAKEWRVLGQNYHSSYRLSRLQKTMGIPARRVWSRPGIHDSLHPSTLLYEQGTSRSNGKNTDGGSDRILDLEHGVWLTTGKEWVETFEEKIDLSIRRSSDVYLEDGRKLWVSADKKRIMVENQSGEPIDWSPERRVMSLGRQGKGLRVMRFQKGRSRADLAFLDPTRGKILDCPDLLGKKLQLGLIRSGRWLIRGAVREGETSSWFWYLYDPISRKTEAAAWLPSWTPGSIQGSGTYGRRTWISALGLTRDDLILYFDLENVLRLMDPETGQRWTLGPEADSFKALGQLNGGPLAVRDRGRSPSGLDIFEVTAKGPTHRYFLYDHENQKVILAPAFAGRLLCVGKQGLYVTEGNQLLRYNFGSDQRELLFPAPEFRENPELGMPSQR